LLSGDKDFIPALVRTRQKGKQVAIVSMRTGCNRALYESPHVKDYAIVWIDDFLDRLIRPIEPKTLPVASVQRPSQSRLVSHVTMMKVICDFITRSAAKRVSSRDVGRHLKNVDVGDGIGGTTNLLEQLKDVGGGLRWFLSQHPSVFRITDRDPEEGARDPRDKSFWIEVTDSETADDILEERASQTKFSDVEEKFLEEYNEKMESSFAPDDEILYYHTLTGESSRVENADLANDDDEYHESSGVNGSKSDLTLDLPPELTMDYSTFTVSKLKDVCREWGLAVTGAKAVLLGRVQDDVSRRVQQLRDEQEINKQYQRQHQLKQPDIRQRQEQKAKSPMQRIRMGGARLSRPVAQNAYTDTTVVNHLDNLVSEYIAARGGQAGSRDVGRYLAVNSSSMRNSGNEEVSSALTELKNTFGSLANYLSKRTDKFIRLDEDPVRYGQEYGFPIRVKR